MAEKSFSLTFAASPSQAGPDGGLPTRFSGVAYSGGIVPAYGDYGDCAIDLDSLQIPGKPLFALVDHDPSQRAGKGTLARTESGVAFEGEFFASTQAGQEVAATFAEGAPWELSVGFVARADSSKKPRACAVNGQELTLSTVFRDARITEVSFVPAGADPHTAVTAFARGANSTVQESPMDDELLERLRYLLNLPTLATVSDITAEVQKLLDRLQSATASQTQAEAAMAAAQQELAQFKAGLRKAEASALFSAIGREPTEEALAPYLEMTEAQFSAIAADLRSVRAPLDPNLARELATGGESPQNAPSAAKLAAIAMNQLKGVKQ